uniref:Uncharacterized protein n=1 Tax=Romanomermis culicivorax TaxID=13658 RepID=A0A915LA48_ROMCU
MATIWQHILPTWYGSVECGFSGHIYRWLKQRPSGYASRYISSCSGLTISTLSKFAEQARAGANRSTHVFAIVLQERPMSWSGLGQKKIGGPGRAPWSPGRLKPMND